MKVVLLFALVSTSLAALPKPKPIVHVEVYQKQQCGPFLEILSKKNAEKLRRIFDQEDLTKKEIDDEVERFVSTLDADTQEKYGSFKRALKVRVLRLKLRHELKMKGLSDEAKKLDEKIQGLIEDKELTWPETVKAKNNLLRKASPKILKELGVKPANDDKDGDPEEEEEEPEEAPQNEFDYEHNAGGKFDYHQNGGNTHFGGDEFDSENAHFGNEENGMRKASKPNPRTKPRPTGRTRAGGHEPDYQQQQNGDDYEH